MRIKKPSKNGCAAALLATGQTKHETSTEIHIIQALHRFTEIYVGRARDLARSGQKDSARDWCRYFENSQISKIVSLCNADKSASLRANISLLNSECHPLDVPDWTVDIQEIRDSLRLILNALNENSKISPRPVSRKTSQKTEVAASWTPRSHRKGLSTHHLAL